jgi:hypothetical protein
MNFELYTCYMGGNGGLGYRITVEKSEGKKLLEETSA